MDIPSPDQAARYRHHVCSRLGDAAGLEAMVGEMGILIHVGPEMGTIGRLTSATAHAYCTASYLADKAAGRKLTDEAKRRKLAATAELLRDAADQLDRMVL